MQLLPTALALLAAGAAGYAGLTPAMGPRSASKTRG